MRSEIRHLLVAAAAVSAGCRFQPDTGDLRCRPSPTDPGAQICEAAPQAEAQSAPTFEDLNPRLLRRFKPLRASFVKDGPAPSAELVELGRMLYYEPRISQNGSVSCNSCHSLASYGTTAEALTVGVDGKRADRNAPSTYNAAAQFALFWDGRSPNVEAQAVHPLLNPREMGMSPDAVVQALSSSRGYAERFHAAFPKTAHPITLDNVGAAIGAFERTLSTPSRWDRYLTGDRGALTDKEKEGLRVFTSVGCMVCHTGELVGGSMYEKLGAAEPWPAGGTDHGRSAITGNPADEMVFKVPSLRNVDHTGPYFHDGSVKTLPEAVRMMATYQLGERLSDAEVDAVVAWLGSLTGPLPASAMRPRLAAATL
jgi:cytochrome c peroxidase